MVIDEQLLGLFSSLRDVFTREFRAWCDAIPGALDAIRDAFIATTDCCFRAFNTMVPAIFSKVKRSTSKPSSPPPSPSTTMEGAVKLQALAPPPPTPKFGGKDISSPTGSPQEPSAFMFDDSDNDGRIASAQADLSKIHLNDRVEASPTLHTIVEESDSRNSSPAMSLTAEQTKHFLAAMTDVVQSSAEVTQADGMTEQCVHEHEDGRVSDKAHQIQEHNSAAARDTLFEHDLVEANNGVAQATFPEGVVDDEDEAVYHDAQDGPDAETLSQEVANTTAVEEFGSDDDEGSSVYSFATTAPSFAGDEHAALSMVSSPFRSERTPRGYDAASPSHQAWNPDWNDHHSPVRSSVKTSAELSTDARALGADHDPPTAAPRLLEGERLSPQGRDAEVGTIDPPLSAKKDVEDAEDTGGEVRSADVVAETHAAEDGELIEAVDSAEIHTVAPSTSEDAGAGSEPVTSGASMLKPPRSYIPTFTGIPPTVTTGVSYRQLSVELNPEAEGQPNFYRIALLKLKQERQLRRLNPTVLEPVMPAPSSNSSVNYEEDEEERRARLNKIAELRKRTSPFEVKIGKPLSVGRVPYSKS